MINGHTVIQYFETLAPKALALEGDPIGLQVGKLNKPVKKVMIALDILEPVIDEAIDNEVDLIIAHHPLIFRPLKKIDTNTAYGRIIEKCMQHHITIYAAHTNLDIANGGINDLMAQALNLEKVEVLAPTTEIRYKKLVVFVPESHEEVVRQALGDAGAGFIGNYSHCSFSQKGVGRFYPTEDANPYLGKVGQLEEASEVRIETILSETIEKKVIQAMIKAHPYEEVAYDLYPLSMSGEGLGLGRVGYLPKEMTLNTFAEYVKLIFGVDGVRVVGNLDNRVKKVAVLGGDGNKYIHHAKMKGADVYVTGDLYYHVAHDALMMGLNCVDPGHNIEKIMKTGVQQYLTKKLEENGYDTKVIVSHVHTDPFTFK